MWMCSYSMLYLGAIGISRAILRAKTCICHLKLRSSARVLRTSKRFPAGEGPARSGPQMRAKGLLARSPSVVLRRNGRRTSLPRSMPCARGISRGFSLAGQTSGASPILSRQSGLCHSARERLLRQRAVPPAGCPPGRRGPPGPGLRSGRSPGGRSSCWAGFLVSALRLPVGMGELASGGAQAPPVCFLREVGPGTRRVGCPRSSWYRATVLSSRHVGRF